MPNHSHPYANLPKQAFWKTAVADLDCLQIDLAWKPKAPINRETRIVTLGSCFAQHISKSLREHGFNWLDSEPAPAALPESEHAKQGYGVFSFRTGNIYTAALLKQWVMWTTGSAEQSRESFLEGGRYFDPFRPALGNEGYASFEEMMKARSITLAAMSETIKQADLFVFTLGLTEAWRSRDGLIYPMCPGTIRGEFSAEDHAFHNYNAMEVTQDLLEAFDELRGINPKLRFLLTVSPVPLTATASDQHVLTATTYSKSVLRSVAGYLVQTREDVDYFPSYELITAPPFKGQFFDANLRSVSEDGVAFVMRHFLRGIGVAADLPASKIRSGNELHTASNLKKSTATDICEDIILESWSRDRPADRSVAPPNIVLIGDSQMGMIAKVLDEQGIRYAGGAIMHGTEWHDRDFEVDGTTYFLPKNADARERWMRTFTDSLSRHSSPDAVTIITNIGAHSFRIFTNEFEEYLTKVSPVRFSNVISDSNLGNFLVQIRQSHLDLVKRFVDAGYKVVWVSDPPFQPNTADIFGRMDNILSEYFRGIGCEVIHTRNWVRNLGAPPSELRSSEINPATGQLDWVHGSPDYYRQLAKEIFKRFSIKPEINAVTRESIDSQVPQKTSDLLPATATAGASQSDAAPLKAVNHLDEDAVLEPCGTHGQNEQGPTNMVLIGDSHMGMISKALAELGIAFAGGEIMEGSQWHDLKFVPVDDVFFVPAEAAAKDRWAETCTSFFQKRPSAATGDKWILTNIGSHSHTLMSNLGILHYLKRIYGTVPNNLNLVDIKNYLMLARGHHVNIVRKFVDAGYKVIWISDPYDEASSNDLLSALDRLLCEYFGLTGAFVFDAREWLRRRGGYSSELKSTEINSVTGALDSIHGSDKYYRELIKEILNTYPISPPVRI